MMPRALPDPSLYCLTSVLLYLPRLGTNPFVDERVDDLERLAAQDRFGAHGLTDDPEEADVVLFPQCHMVDWRLRAISNHPIARRYWSKVMVYDERDQPWRSFPGLYMSMPARSFDARTERPWGYLKTPRVPSSSADPDLLFSFVGSRTARCRESLLELSHPHAIVEAVTDFTFWDNQSPRFAERRARYEEVLARSRFVLCPRGRGTSSFRLYEVLAAARVPVIVADDWVAPQGPDWDACSLRFPEGQTDGLIELMEDRNQDWLAMSQSAAEVHATFFARDVMFHRVAELCAALQRGGGRPSLRSIVRMRAVGSSVRVRLSSGVNAGLGSRSSL